MKYIILFLLLLLLALGTPIKSSAQVEFVIPMTEGWNMISAPVIPEERDSFVIFLNLIERGSLIIAKDGEGHFGVPGFGWWMLGDWVYSKGYQLKLSEDDTLTIVGEPVDPETPIQLLRGWSLIAYFPEEQLDAITAFSNIEEVLIIAKDGSGNFYRPEYNFSNMGELRQGRGYMVKVSEAVELIWNVP